MTTVQSNLRNCMNLKHPSGIHAGPPLTHTRAGTLKAESSIGSEDELGRLPGREK